MYKWDRARTGPHCSYTQESCPDFLWALQRLTFLCNSVTKGQCLSHLPYFWYKDRAPLSGTPLALVPECHYSQRATCRLAGQYTLWEPKSCLEEPKMFLCKYKNVNFVLTRSQRKFEVRFNAKKLQNYKVSNSHEACMFSILEIPVFCHINAKFHQQITFL